MPSTAVPPKFDEKDFRPFLRLADHLPEPFLKRAEAWHILVSSYGIDHVEKPPETKEEYQQFYAFCHEGWKKAQTEIAAFLIDALGQRAKAVADEKESRRRRDKDAQKVAQLARRRIDLQMRVARRTLDVILWTIVGGEHSTMRRLIVRGGHNSLSVENIKVAMAAADQLNRDPLVMAVSTDMLSLVHVGDLIVVDGRAGQVRFVELKAGAKNVLITELAEFAVRSKCPRFENLATAEMTETDRRHFSRVKKQAERNETIISTINNEGGTDHNTGDPVVISPLGKPSEYWTDEIQQCYESLTADRRWAIAAVEDCVYLGVYSDQNAAAVGFLSWMHVMGCGSPVFNLTDSFANVAARPLGATYLSRELREKILRGDVLVIMCLDVQAFMELGNRIAPGSMSLASKAETARQTQRQSHVEFLMLDGRLIRSGSNDEASFLGVGMRDRILFDQHSPSQLLAHPVDFSKRPRVAATGSAT